MRARRGWVVLVVVALIGVAVRPAAAAEPTPPGRPTTGFGSTQGYISAGATPQDTGSAVTGSRVWWFTPTTLRDGTSAPVVVFLHGFQLPSPDIYQGHIDHLTRLGYIVVYPQINLPVSSILFDTNQNTMLTRAIDATEVALARLGTRAGSIHLYGHSLGGLLAAAWTARGGPAPTTVTLANPSTSAGGPVGIGTPIDWRTAAASTTAPVVILTGSADTIAPPSQSLDLYDAMTNASSRVVYRAPTDGHGSPDLDADHMAPIQDDGGIPSLLMDFFGGDGEEDALDFRFYYAALDAVLAGNRTVTFAPGAWSDGQAVVGPTTLAQYPTPPPPTTTTTTTTTTAPPTTTTTTTTAAPTTTTAPSTTAAPTTTAVSSTTAAPTTTAVPPPPPVDTHQPDAQLRRGDSAVWAGVGIHTADGTGQARYRRVPAGRAAAFVLRIEDDGTAADGDTGDTFAVRGGAGGPTFSVRYRDPVSGADRTKLVVAGKLVVPAGTELDIVVRPRAGSAPGRSRTLLVTATSVLGGGPVDGVKAVTVVGR